LRFINVKTAQIIITKVNSSLYVTTIGTSTPFIASGSWVYILFGSLVKYIIILQRCGCKFDIKCLFFEYVYYAQNHITHYNA